MPTAATSQTVRISFQRASLTDQTIYYFDFNALAISPEIYKEVEKQLKADGEYENVVVSVRTVTP